MYRSLLAFLGLSIAAMTSGMASDAWATPAGLALPRPGSYTLNHIQRVPFAIVLEGNYIPRPLSRYTKGAITLLSFFYTSCGDPQGCPRAWDAFESIRHTIEARRDLHGKVRLVFVSLDPRHDTPQMLEVLARSTSADSAIVPWHFLTTYSTVFLDRLLRDMGTEISIDQAASEGGTPVLNHLLKVFLIDRRGWVREIYANATLDPVVILGDIETLVIENGHKSE
jgi:cytochrome oxidase Cu insertion factor (SCO1/SenC/PrrC family)